MNTYNDNLRSSVVDSLNNQELERKKMEAAMNASKFTLYYAQGATITDAEKLLLAEEDAAKKKKVKSEAVINSNLSTNVLTSAKQQKTFTDQSVKNTAVSASNVQIATNAVVKLASDMGSIASIINAADYGTDIYELCETTKGYMETTAGDAEVASQYAMEASEYVSEVSSDNVEKQATTAHTAIQNLLGVATSEYEAANDLVTQDNAKHAAASVKEKEDEGKLEDANVDYHAAKKAYKKMSKELNLHLRVEDTTFAINTADSDLKITVKFDALKSAFPAPDYLHSIVAKSEPMYPVEEYRLFIVKSNKESTFNIATAENIYNQDSAKPNKLRFIPVKKTDAQKIDVEVNVSSVSKYRDTDGDKIEFGQNYVVFVYAKYLETYKSELNNFENFLSAGSYMFTLTEELDGPEAQSIVVEEEIDILVLEEDYDAQFIIDNDILVDAKIVENDKWPLKLEKNSYTLQFELADDANAHHNVEYRCMFLPADSELTRSLLTEKTLKSIEKADEKIEKLFEHFAGKILQIQGEILTTEDTLEKTTDEDEKKSLKKTLAKQRAKLKAAEQALESHVNQIKQTKNKSDFDAFQQMLQEFQGSEPLDEIKANFKNDFALYSSYGIATDELKKFKEDMNSALENKDAILNNNLELDALNMEKDRLSREIGLVEEGLFIQNQIVDSSDSTAAEKDAAKSEIKNLEKILKDLNKEMKDLQGKIKSVNKDNDKLSEKNDTLITKMTTEAKKLDKEFQKHVGVLSFYFDLDISEQISTANYSLAKAKTDSVTAKSGKEVWEMTVKANTTDNFGNPLMDGVQYIPVVLAYSTAPEVDADKYTNKLSDVDNTKKFTYHDITVKSDDDDSE